MADLNTVIHVKLDRQLPILELDDVIYELFNLEIFQEAQVGKVNAKPFSYELDENVMLNSYYTDKCSLVELEEDNKAYLNAWFFTRDFENAVIFNVGPSNVWGRELLIEHFQRIAQHLRSAFAKQNVGATIVYTVDIMEDSIELFRQLEQQASIQGIVKQL